MAAAQFPRAGEIFQNETDVYVASLNMHYARLEFRYANAKQRLLLSET
jgi:hypothetical protein